MPPTLRSRTSKNSNCIILLDSSFTTEEKGVESINEVEILDTTLHDSPSDNEVSGSDSAVDTLDNHSENSTSSNYLVTRLKNIEANKALLKSLSM
ncbi:hypothetical protein HMI54_012039 [Coelomomyces lativittatus]|nr:hypothetical protein HMI55_005454 [Coelomomyces lativittatus]KAJ1515610.1 hypothetical protein HMI54_012039 [Coelomomyces lativittatus]